MKRLFVLAVAVAFVALGAQAFASPPVPPPVEGFTITTATTIECVGTVTETEKYDNTYYSGYGTGGHIAGPGAAAGSGWTSGAQVAYQQDFKALNGLTTFVKDFAATTDSVPNLVVDKVIGYTADPNNVAAVATHSEKVGLSVVSQGGSLGPNLGGLLSLCPWVTSGGTYPATNEGIAAGSTFKVTELQNFNTTSNVTSTAIPALNYVVDAPYGVGDISAKFVVELFEGVKGTTWPGGTTPPPLESRTSYSEAASASGQFAFKKEMGYKSSFPTLGNIDPFANLLK